MLAEHGIKPVIENRSLGKDDLERMLPGHDGSSTLGPTRLSTVARALHERPHTGPSG